MPHRLRTRRFMSRGARSISVYSGVVSLIAVIGLAVWGGAGVGLQAAGPNEPAALPREAESESAASDEDVGGLLAKLKQTGLERSRFRHAADAEQTSASVQIPEPDLEAFETRVKPLLAEYCFDCHGEAVTEGNIRVDTLDPNLLTGADADWWTEVFAVVTKGEMPPPDAMEMDDAERRVLVDWLSSELQSASMLRRGTGAHSTFRRLTRYEYNYALQDLLGVPWEFAKDLPPEPKSEDGFQNRAELLHLSVSQFETLHRIAREALRRVTVSGERPAVRYWGVSMEAAAAREWAKQDAELEKAKGELGDKPEQLAAELERLRASFQQSHRSAYYKQRYTGRTAKATWVYYNAKYAFAPVDVEPEFPQQSDCVAVIPGGGRQNLVVELGNQLPDEGTMRVTVRASRVETGDGETGAAETEDGQAKREGPLPSLQLLFGWQASNEGRALLRVSEEDVLVTGTPDAPQMITWDVPLGEIYPRNSVRKTSPMGATPSPSEYIRIANSSAGALDVQIDFVKVETPVYESWPPPSHQRIFFPSELAGSERVEDQRAYAEAVLARFMSRAWRRALTEDELAKKVQLFERLRPECDSFEEAMIEVLATVLSSPQFLYVTYESHAPEMQEVAGEEVRQGPGEAAGDAFGLANRLALFLWCSVPDETLLALAESGQLSDPEVLTEQVDRMLADPRAERFAEHFVRQWLNLELLDFVNFRQKVGGFDPLLKEAMRHEPVAMFVEMLRQNASVLDVLHCDYAMVNERLAKHYGLSGVYGNHFRRVSLGTQFQRGGLLTQAGVLAMNSDWPDSHPLKRAIWLLECVLNDPPPPPPPAVPQIDLADPEIAKMTLKERMEDHRNQAACRSCHMKIDPWGIAFENYDALGRWRNEIRGQPVDASSELFNRQVLDGMDGLKRFLLEERQDQVVGALVQKLTSYALGRHLGFEDRVAIDAITAQTRQQGDGLRTAIHAIVQSDLFRKP